MKRAIFPGTFDPPTFGHLDIIERASRVFDHLYIAVGHNLNKPYDHFTIGERIKFLKMISHDIPNVEIVPFEGLLADFANRINVSTIIRAIRTGAEFEAEAIQASMNWNLGHLETLYMVASNNYRLISSSLVREVAQYGRRLHAFVPEEIEEMVFERLSTTCNKD